MNKKYIVIILVVLVCLGFVIYGLVYNHSNSNNKNDEKRKNDISYEDFKKEYGEYNWEDSEIREDNYHLFEDEFFSRKYSKMLDCEIKKVNKDAFLILNNTSDEYLGTIETTIIFYDANNQIIDVQNSYVDELEYGGKTIKSIYKVPQEYARVEFFNKIDKTNEIPKLRVSNIKCELINEEESIKITNNNAEKCESVHGIILFYDEYGNVISNSYIYAYGEIEANESRIEKLYNYPHSFDSYDVIISRIR